ncbi:MAG: hypothetical protein OHK0012_20970 [Synechococcales cyanobacterium]
MNSDDSTLEAAVRLLRHLSGSASGIIYDRARQEVVGQWGKPTVNLTQSIHQGSLEVCLCETSESSSLIQSVLTLLEHSRHTANLQLQLHTEQKQRLIATHENETLLREIHHRVKNNLQVISSLLRLQSYRFHEGDILSAFEDMQNRIQAMARLHERLYRSDSLKVIDAKPYVEALVTTLKQLYQEEIEAKDIQIELDVTVPTLAGDTAISYGLIIHELLTNAIKHAFPSSALFTLSPPHRIDVLLNSPNLAENMLEIRDNGIGIVADFGFHTSDSIGLQLVCDLVDQLHGSLAVDRQHGTSLRITFPVDDPSPPFEDTNDGR